MWRRVTLEAWLVLLCACTGTAPKPTPPAAPSSSSGTTSEACLAALGEQQEGLALLRVGRLERGVRTLRQADARCPELARDSQLGLVNALGELGDAPAFDALRAELEGQPELAATVQQALDRWAPRVRAPSDGATLVQEGRAARARGAEDFQRYFDRALVAFQKSTGTTLALDLQNGFFGGVSALAWHGDRLAVAGSDLSLLDARTFEVRTVLPGPDGPVSHLRFASDGERLLAGSEDDELVVLDVASRTVLLRSAFREMASATRFVPGGLEVLASIDERDLEWQPLVVDRDATGPFSSGVGAVSADGLWVSVRVEPNIEVRRLDGALRPFTLRSHLGANGVGDAMLFSPDQRLLAAIAGDFDVVVYDLDRRSKLAQFSHDGTVTTLAFSADARRLASGGFDHSVRVWDLGTKSEHLRVVHDSEVTAIAFSPDGTRLASGSPDGVLRVWDLASKSELFASKPHVPRVDALRFAANGNLLAGMSDGSVRVWGGSEGHVSLKTTTPEQRLREVWMHPTEPWVVATSTANALSLWQLPGREPVRTTVPRSRFMVPATHDPRGQVLFFADDDGSVRKVDLRTGKEHWNVPSPGPRIARSLAVSHDGRTLALGGQDHELYLLDARTGALRQSLDGHRWLVDQILFTQNDRRIVSRGSDVRVWDVASGRTLVEHREVPGNVTVIALSPDDRFILLHTDHGVTKELDASTGQELRRFDLGGLRPTHLAYANDGRYFAAASWHNELGIWSTATGHRVVTLHAVDALDAGYLTTPDGRVEFVGHERERAKRHARCRFGELLLDFDVCEDRVSAARLYPVSAAAR